MSVVAVKIYKDKIEMSADSILVCGDRKEIFFGKHTKIKEINGMIIGTTGTAEEEGLMWLYAQNHSPLSDSEKDILDFFVEFVSWKSGKSTSTCLDNQYLLIYKNKAFHIHNFLVLEVDNFSAIGAGADFALAALYLDKTPYEAVKVACDLSCYVAEPIITYTHHKNINNPNKNIPVV